MRLIPRLGFRAALLSALFVVWVLGGPLPFTPHAAPAVALAQDEEPAANSSKEEGKSPQNTLEWLFYSLGWLYTAAFLAISFTFLAALVMNLLAARRASVLPARLVEQFEAHLNEKRYQEAYEVAKADDSILGAMLATGMAKLAAGYDQVLVAMQRTGEDEALRIEHRLSYIALMGTLAPLVGLLGAVDKMHQIAQDVSLRPNELANGISAALVRTCVGLVLAILAIVVFNVLRNRFGRLLHEVGGVSEGLMSRFDAAKK